MTAGLVEGARLASGDGARVVERVVIDSREAGPGALFVALAGERTDGHAFLGAAAGAGCAAVVCEPGRAPDLGDVAVLEAASPLACLQALARQVDGGHGERGGHRRLRRQDDHEGRAARAVRAARPTWRPRRTTTTSSACRSPCSASREITEIAICELAMRAAGEIAELAAIAEPDAGLITNVGPEHLEFLGSVENVARTEAELLGQLPAGKLAVLPFHEPLSTRTAAATCAPSPSARSPRPTSARCASSPDRPAPSVELEALGQRVSFETNLRAPHAAANLAAAVAVYAGLGLPLDGVGEGAAQIQLSPWRGQERPRGRGGVVINDAYNANPLSMRAALSALVQRAGEARSVAVLGEMAELGADAPRFHREVGEHAAACGVDVLVGIGELARSYRDGAAGGLEVHWFAGQTRPPGRSAALLRPDDVVLLKASGPPASRPSTRRSRDPRPVRRRPRHVLCGRHRRRSSSASCAPALRPEHPRGGAGRPQDQAGHADDGRRCSS